MHAIEIFYSEEDRGFIAVVPELAGCAAFGETEEVALQEVKIAMQLWLQTAKEIGRVIPVPQKHVSQADSHAILSVPEEKFGQYYCNLCPKKYLANNPLQNRAVRARRMDYHVRKDVAQLKPHHPHNISPGLVILV